MQVAEEFTDLLLDELVCHYGPDEPFDITDPDVRSAHLDDMARRSAGRLATKLGEAKMGQFVPWLSSLRENPGHALFIELEKQTQMSWSEDESWQAFYELGGRIIRAMQQMLAA